jgi:hypothetical protein
MEWNNELALSGGDLSASDRAQGSIFFVGNATVILRYAGFGLTRAWAVKIRPNTAEIHYQWPRPPRSALESNFVAAPRNSCRSGANTCRFITSRRVRQDPHFRPNWTGLAAVARGLADSRPPG